MRLDLDIAWEKYALIAEIIRRFQAEGITLCKTALQKMIFLLQRVFGFDCDYAYTFYTYGPYCADVARDLDIVEGFGGAEVIYNWGYAGYEIRPGPATDDLCRRGAEFLKQIAGALDQLIADYGGATAKNLELRSTLVYLAKPGRSDKELVCLVRGVKPHFTVPQIETALQELQEKGYLKTAMRTARTRIAAN